MKIAIPTWRERVSPVLDVAEICQLIEIGNHGEWRRDVLNLGDCSLSTKVSRFVEFGVDVIICGALSRELEQMIMAVGIQLIPHTCGPVEQVLNAFLRHGFSEEPFLMPGCCGRRRRWGGGRQTGASQVSPLNQRRQAMPRGDGTGPMGQGPGTGRGMGPCPGNRTAGGQKPFVGPGQQIGRGGGRGRGRGLKNQTNNQQN